MGDREYLIAVLENLLQNAVDAMMGRDTTPYIQVEIGCEFEWGYIRIKDNGLGISKENLRKIFSPFFTTKATKKNWGLGLAFCHRVINAHRGFLNIWTSPGNGTTVEVVMRCREKIDTYSECRWKPRFLWRKHPPTHQREYGG
jgi:signal transduction histidine kinase